MDINPRVLYTKSDRLDQPDPLYFEHLQYDPDLSTYGRDKRVVKIVMDCRTADTL